MGAFFLFHTNARINPEKALNIFRDKGFDVPAQFDLDGYRLFHFNKIINKTVHYHSDGMNSIFITGTMIYKGKNACDSMKELLRDFNQEQIDYDSLIGHFCTIIHANGFLYLLNDNSGTYNIYYDTEKKVFSSSFLAILFSREQPVNINKNALTEILLTGNLIGPDTQAEGIFRLEKETIEDFENITILKRNGNTGLEIHNEKNRNECLREQAERLDLFFKYLSAYADEQGPVIGLTGGFDSRLLLSLAVNHFSGYEVFTHWQNGGTGDFRVSKILAEKLRKELVYVEEHDVLDKDKDDIIRHIQNAYLFTDGQIRSQYYWHEIYNTADYYKKINVRGGLLLNGVGGEQYRNTDGAFFSFNSFDKWLRNNILFEKTADIFTSSKKKEDFYAYYRSKVLTKLGSERTIKFNHLLVKRYQNEIYNLSNRTLRANVENQLMGHLSPFTDEYLSHFAYRAVPWLGISSSFEMDLIKFFSPLLASVISNYGFAFDKKEPWKRKAIQISKSAIPNELLKKIIQLTKRHSGNLSRTTQHLNELTPCRTEPELNVKIENILKCPELNPLLFQVNYFTEKIKQS